MTAKQKLIAVMRYKNKQLQHLHLGYFTKKDEEAILAWSDRTCENVRMALLTTLREKPTDEISDAEICCFCIFHEAFTADCYNKCEYGIAHGNCAQYNSTYKKVVNALDAGSIIEYLSDKNLNYMKKLLEKK